MSSRPRDHPQRRRLTASGRPTSTMNSPSSISRSSRVHRPRAIGIDLAHTLECDPRHGADYKQVVNPARYGAGCIPTVERDALSRSRWRCGGVRGSRGGRRSRRRLAGAARRRGAHGLDALALGLALFAAWLALRPATPERSFGWRRAEVLAALRTPSCSCSSAAGSSGPRSGGSPTRPASSGLGARSRVAGLVVNSSRRGCSTAGLGLERSCRDAARPRGSLRRRRRRRGGLVMLATGWALRRPDRGDPDRRSGSVASTAGVLRETDRSAPGGAPAGMDARRSGAAIASRRVVVGVHDLHLWTITSGFPALSAHVLVEAGADCPCDPAESSRAPARAFELTHHDTSGRARSRTD
jgi:cobalt-zinc-cadmium efflux system protein